MTHEDFNRLLEERIAKMRATLAAKAEEYATQDRLHNFKEAAHLQSESPEKALLGMLVKHWVSVQDVVRDRLYYKSWKPELLDEKIGDAICYLVLLEALLKEPS